jgi:predicted lipoprotein with Yx(FWY)xxD motif
MKKAAVIVIAVVVCVAIVGGVWWYLQQGVIVPTAAPADTSSATDTATGAPVLTESSSDALGNYLTAASNGMSLYIYSSDTSGVSNCTDTCAATWPPYTVASADNLTAATGITGTLSTITRADGSLQVTYNGAPLYFYSKDVNAGDTTGDGVGGAWSIARP